MRFVFILCSLLFFGFLVSAGPRDSIRMEKRGELFFIVHQVEEKETLYGIARRYKSTVRSVVEENSIVNNQIEIGQILWIPLVPVSTTKLKIAQNADATLDSSTHIVVAGETLYSISRLHNLSVDELKELNALTSNDISPGTTLVVTRKSSPISINEVDSAELVTDTYLAQFEKYLVQTGERLSMIAEKTGNLIDSLRYWNNLEDDYLSIGQKLLYKPRQNNESISNQVTSSLKTEIDDKGFEKIYEQGVATMIENMNTDRFFALHRNLPIGTKLEVRNLMNNRVVHVKVVGILPDTGLNKNILVRLSEKAYDQLGILDKKSGVEIAYFKP